MKIWTQDEIDILKKYYHIKGSKYCGELLDRSRQAIAHRASILKLSTSVVNRNGIKRMWDQKEDDILRTYYSTHGVKYCVNMLDRSDGAIRNRANLLDLCTNIINGFQQRKILEELANNLVLVMCKKHGKTSHRLFNGKINTCIKCQHERNIKYGKTDEGLVCLREKSKRYRQTLIGKVRCRLQASLNNALKSKNITKTRRGCFFFLPYSPQELVQHLKELCLYQNNQCPICYISYNISSWTIDHIIPIKTAKNIKNVFELFNLDNLSLLCQSCNRNKGSRILTLEEIKGMTVNGY